MPRPKLVFKQFVSLVSEKRYVAQGKAPIF